MTTKMEGKTIKTFFFFQKYMCILFITKSLGFMWKLMREIMRLNHRAAMSNKRQLS